ncbi:cold-shock protein [Streptomyces sp. NPDC053086]|uniref:cold-shock protein n=1 Tax=unclassified Streptomyces TaxID=2593676 RepID=UPI003700BD2B
MPLGRIAVYNDADGVGIITDEHGQTRPFSGMETQTTREGQRVAFEVVGAKATNVIVVR